MTWTAHGEAESDWVVDVATGRVIHRRPAAKRAPLDGQRTLKSHATDWEGTRLTDEKQREQAKKDLSPIEDIKGAIRFVKDLDPIDDIKEFMEHAVEALDPRESDIRAVLPEEDSHSEMEEKR